MDLSLIWTFCICKMELKPQRVGVCKDCPRVCQWPLSPDFPDASDFLLRKGQRRLLPLAQALQNRIKWWVLLPRLTCSLAVKVHLTRPFHSSGTAPTDFSRSLYRHPAPRALHLSAQIHSSSLDLNVTSSGSLPLFSKVIGPRYLHSQHCMVSNQTCTTVEP